MKFWRRHNTAVLTGEAAREFMEREEPGHEHWATAVAICSCGWHETAIHGERAAEMADRHHPSKVPA